MKKILYLLTLAILPILSIHAQQVIVTDDAGYTTPASGSVLDVSSTTRGLIIPRMTTAQRTTLGGNSPADGVVVYDTEINGFYYWDNGSWHQIAASDLNLTNIKFGDGSNYSTFEADGTLVFYGNATVWEDLRISLNTRYSGNTTPDLDPFAGSSSLLEYTFDGGSQMEEIFFEVQLPHSWAEGTTIKPHVHWSPRTAGTGNVVWQFEYTWSNFLGTYPTPTTITVTQAADGTAYKSQIAAFPDITDATKKISSLLMCRLFRDPSHTSDTYAGDAYLLGFDIHYEINTVGSRQEYTKTNP